MKKIIKIINVQENNVLDIRFWPTDICNYDCSYCFPNSKDAIYRYPKNVDTVVRNFRKLFNVYNEKFGKDTFYINLVGGGEPTLWPQFSYFCEHIKKEHNVRLQVTTNGSRTLRWWEENIQYLDKVVLSCHNEFVDLENFINVADYVYEQGKVINALVLMDAPNFDKCVNIVETMKSTSKHPWLIEVKTVVDSPGHDVGSYTEEQLKYMRMGLKRIPDGEWILKHMDQLVPFKSIGMFDDGSVKPFKPDDYISQQINNFYNWKCNVSIENLVISYDGKVTGSCQEEVFTNTNLNMFSENFEEEFNSEALALKPIICPRLHCGCTPDTHITKEKVQT
jgi:MoaA/NifB/PqqE/SkfB family radical SAM enzyme